MQYSRRGLSEAVSLAERAHEIEPDNGRTTDTFGWILSNNSDTDRALELLRESVRQAPDNSEIRYHLASLLAAAGETDEAKNMITELLVSGAIFESRDRAEDLAKSL